jgi:hypothetical protein
MNERNQNTDEKLVSDVMIVKCGEHDYYVSEKIKGREVYAKFLKKRSFTSTHYNCYSDAMTAAKSLQAEISAQNPGCEVVEIDFTRGEICDFVRYDDILCDESGNKVIGIANGKSVILDREGDEAYKFVDIEAYYDAIDCKIRENEEQEFNFFYVGKVAGYRFAREARLKYLYHEIYKAELFLAKLKADEELYAGDIIYYNGFKAALKDSVEIQRSCVWRPREWSVRLLDLSTDNSAAKVSKNGRVDGIGNYTVTVVDDKEELIVDGDVTTCYLVLVDKTTEKKRLAAELGLTDKVYHTIMRIKDDSTVVLNAVLPNYRTLSSGDPDYKISRKWIGNAAAPDEDDE